MLRHIQRVLRRIDADNLTAAAHQRRNGKTAGVGEAVQHAFIFHITARGETAVALIQVITRFMAAFYIHQQLHAVLFNREQIRRQLAADRPLSKFHAFFFTHRDVGAVIDGAFRIERLQGRHQRRALIFRARREQLQHQEVAEAVNRHARQAVRFAGDKTVAVKPVLFRQPVAPLLRLLQAASKKGDINGFIRIKRPDARSDLRGGGEGGAC